MSPLPAGVKRTDAWAMDGLCVVVFTKTLKNTEVKTILNRTSVECLIFRGVVSHHSLDEAGF